jgi:hypothetical protein
LVGHIRLGEVCRACSMRAKKRNSYEILVRKPDSNRSLSAPKRRWVKGKVRPRIGHEGPEGK